MTQAPTADAANLLALENQVCFALAVASRSVLALYRPILEPLGLTHPQYLVMLALWEHSPRSVTELGSALQLEPATLSPLLKRLEATGYVRRERSTRDERVLDITLTDVGRNLRDQAESIPPKIISELGMSVDELTRMRETLHTVIAAATRA
ncbi:MarR family winged helix-turn-helix transcriptional regulator [Mycetocola sp.]|uniref:MarR family winged helix-turn-helix transcriptional regulator n=1 Tax=Mycetocola sp. TaxID=1871042 RepID=UPI003988B733